MAASSPVLGNNSIATPPKTLRGLNKPKCSQCGNVARSSFESQCNIYRQNSYLKQSFV